MQFADYALIKTAKNRLVPVTKQKPADNPWNKRKKKTRTTALYTSEKLPKSLVAMMNTGLLVQKYKKLFECPEESDSDDDDGAINSTKPDFDGIRIDDRINLDLRQSYFKIQINQNIKYLHKQQSCWLLSNNITKLSSDHLSNVK